MGTFWAILLVGLGLAAPVAAGESRGLAVVELFTSQGCSSCPPADTFLSELAERADVLALSFHVDYWDYIGWKDPYSSPENTQRQRDYARRFNLPYVYTPQMVVGGALQAAGTDRATVGAALRGSLAQVHRAIVLDLRRETNGDLTLTLPALGQPSEEFDVWRVVFDRERVTQVARGENRGRTIVNRNVVRSLERLPAWPGGAETRRLASPGTAGDGLAILVQQRTGGQVVAAGYLTSP